MAAIFRRTIPQIRGGSETLLTLDLSSGSPQFSLLYRVPCVNCQSPLCRTFHTSTVINAALPKKGTGVFKAGMTVSKKKIDVETDPHKLVTHLCGGQYLKEGPEIKLKADHEYPDWLWTLRTTGPPQLHELDPNTVEYWERVYELNKAEYRRLHKAARGKYWEITMQRRRIQREALWSSIKRWKETGSI